MSKKGVRFTPRFSKGNFLHSKRHGSHPFVKLEVKVFRVLSDEYRTSPLNQDLSFNDR